jgi:ribosome-associated protein
MNKKKKKRNDTQAYLARLIQEALLDKKAENITVFPIDPAAGIADWFVVCESDNAVHNRAIADGLVDALQEKGLAPWHVEGKQEAGWIVVDYVDVVVHIMLQSVRELYQLETLWSERGVKAAARS